MIFIRNLNIVEFKSAMKSEFEMINLGLMKYNLGIEVEKYEKVFLFSKRSMLMTSSQDSK